MNKKVNYELEILKMISEISGYSIDELDKEMFLEADLGFDSIKNVKLMSDIMNMIPEELSERFSEENPISKLMQLETIEDLINVFKKFECNDDEIQERELCISNSQYTFLASYYAVGTISLCSYIKFKGILNIEILQRSWKRLIEAFPVLQGKFIIDKNAKSFKDYKFVTVSSKQLPQIDIKDISLKSNNEQQNIIDDMINERINSKFDLEKWPLHKFELLKVSNDEYVLLLSNSHLVSDGLGNQRMLCCLLSIYENMSKGNSDNINIIDVDKYNNIVSKINEWNNEEENSILNDYIKNQGREKYLFESSENNESKEPCAKVKNIKFSLSREETKLLKEFAQRMNVSVFVVLVAVYTSIICNNSNKNEAVINLPTGGRIYPNADATDLLGCFAENICLTFKNENADFSEYVKYVNSEINKALINGLDRAQTRQMSDVVRERELLKNGVMNAFTSNFIRASLKSNIYLSFIGETGIGNKYGDIDIIDYCAYTSTNSNAIDNVVEIFDSKLYVSSNYDSNYFSENEVTDLIGGFIEKLKLLTESKIKENTFSDNINKSIDNNTKDLVLKIFNEITGIKFKDSDIDKNLGNELGIDSLEKIRLISKISKSFDKVNKQKVFEAQTIREICSVVNNNTEEVTIPYMKIIEQCKNNPNDIAILYNEIKVTYEQLDKESNKIANFLRENGVEKNSLVGIMVSPGPMMMIGILGILKAGGAYVPIDFTYPSDRIKYIINHSKCKIILTEHSIKEKLFNIISDNNDIDIVGFLDNGEYADGAYSFMQVSKEKIYENSDNDIEIINSPDDLMLIIYTSGSTGNPKGVMLNHKGYYNRIKWHQKMFDTKRGDRIAQKTSCCFDISIWELFWPLMYGATQCPIDKDIIKNPWSLAKFLEDKKINVMHFVPSLFGEFVNSIEDDDYKFESLRWLIFSGEALPISYIQKWMDKYGNKTGLANLYGPTEASIDVSYHIITERPGSRGESSIPIGKAIDNVYLVNLDSNNNIVPKGEKGELCIGGIQLALGYLNDKEKTEKAFIKNPIKELDTEYLYRTGDLVLELDDGEFEYCGRIDNQIKIRGFRVELGEIESVLYKNTDVKEAAVVDVDIKNSKKIVACISGTDMDDDEIMNLISKNLTYYMMPHMIKRFSKLPKNSNGKIDRKAIKKLILDNINQDVFNFDELENVQEKVSPKMETTSKSNSSGELYSLTPAQKWLVNYFEYPYKWTGYNRFLYKNKLDISIFKESLKKLAEKHEVLRSRFISCNNEIKQKIEETINLDIPMITLNAENISSSEVENIIQENINSIIQELTIEQFPLWKVLVVKVKAGYDITVIGHHMISDLLTNQILFKDIWNVYAKLLCGKDEDYSNNSRRYLEYLREMENEKKNRGNEFLSYWMNQFKDENDKFFINKDIESSLNIESSAATCKLSLSEELTSILLSNSKKYYKSNVYSIILAGLYKSLSKKYNREKVIVAHRVNGRTTDKQLYLETAGDFAVNYPLLINVSKSNDNSELISDIKNRMNEVPIGGAGYDLVSEKLPGYMYPDNKLTCIRANYLGNREQSNFKFIDVNEEHRDKRYSIGNQKRISDIEFFFYIRDKKLNIDIEYSKNMFKEGTIKDLGQFYIDMLSSIILESVSSYDEVAATVNDDNKVVVITGAAGGIGSSIANKFADKDTVIVLLSRNIDKMKALKESLVDKAKEVMYLSVNIKDLKEVDEAVNKIIGKYKKIDVLVNNAGITQMCSLVNSKPEDWINIINTNIIGTFNVTYKIVPHMIAKKCGKIINIGSDSSFIGYPLMSAYAASKHAVLGFTQSLAEELKSSNIQVNCVCPAIVDTDMAPSAFRSKAISPEKVASVVKFLASEASDAVVGEAIRVYGNQDMNWFGSKDAKMLEMMMKSGNK